MIDLIPMRRKRQALSEEACIEVLERGTSGVLVLEIEVMTGKEASELARRRRAGEL